MFALASTIVAIALIATPAPITTAGADRGLAEQASRTQGQVQREPVDINAATSEDLQKVPGIGEALASRIVEFRQEHGRFEKVDDLLNVRGIGVASLDKLRPYLVVKPRG